MGSQTKIATFLLGSLLVMRGILTPFEQPLILHTMDLGFLAMGAFHIAGIVAGWLQVERQPWIVWQGEYKYGGLTRSIVPLLVAFFLIVIVMATGVVLLSPDIAELMAKKGR